MINIINQDKYIYQETMLLNDPIWDLQAQIVLATYGILHYSV